MAPKMWWIYIIVVAVLAFGIYAFTQLVGFRVRWMTRKTTRTAESMYGDYADSPRKQRRYARQQVGEWRDAESGSAHGTWDGNAH